MCCSTLLYITARPSRVASFLSAPIKNTTDAISSLANPVVLVMPFFIDSVSLERRNKFFRLFLFDFFFCQVPRRGNNNKVNKSKDGLIFKLNSICYLNHGKKHVAGLFEFRIGSLELPCLILIAIAAVAACIFPPFFFIFSFRIFFNFIYLFPFSGRLFSIPCIDVTAGR